LKKNEKAGEMGYDAECMFLTFALGLYTDLLHFAGQVLQAYPDPIAGVP
jgi:hypothetical protein